MQTKPIQDYSTGQRFNSKKPESQIKQSLSPVKQQGLISANRPLTQENQLVTKDFQITQSAISQSTIFNARRKKTQLPDINSKGRVQKNQKTDTLFQFMQSSQEFQDILLVEKDERYRYLIKNGSLRRVENNGNIIFSELPQIQGIWVCYRRPCERIANLEKMNLDYLDLTHMALLEGEEKLKILTYQHNRIIQIENLVSLPNLLYLDLYDNQIKDIDGLKQVPLLKVLLLPKNNLQRIINLEHLAKLEVLDLHSNKIMTIEGIVKLKHLRILNLANNLIAKIEGIENLNELIELNLKINQIEVVENLHTCHSLNKLFLSQNKIIKLPLQLPSSMIEVSFDNNPISSNSIGGFSIISTKKAEYVKLITQLGEKIKIFDGKTVEQWKDEVQKESLDNAPRSDISKRKQSSNIQVTTNKTQSMIRRTQQLGNVLEIQGRQQQQQQQPHPQQQQQLIVQNNSNTTNLTTKESIPAPVEEKIIKEQTPLLSGESKLDESEDVIQIIKVQWDKELQRVHKLEQQGYLKKQLLQQSEVEGGHAEIEDDTFLLIYGTAYQIVLPTQNFPEVVDKLHLQYILFDSLIDQCLVVLKSYKKLREVILKDNFIHGLLQLAKLESLSNLRQITIGNNPICNCHFLLQFLVYRFPILTQINGKDVREIDRSKAKQMFQNFDRILQIPEKFYNPENLRNFDRQINAQPTAKKDKVYIKNFNKAINESVEKLYQPKINQEIEKIQTIKAIENAWDTYVESLVIGCQLQLLK